MATSSQIESAKSAMEAGYITYEEYLKRIGQETSTKIIEPTDTIDTTKETTTISSPVNTVNQVSQTPASNGKYWNPKTSQWDLNSPYVETDSNLGSVYSDEYAGRADQYQELFGEKYTGPTTIEGAVSEGYQNMQEEKTALEESLELQKKALMSQIEGAEKATKAQFAQGREGAISSTRAMLPSKIQEYYDRQVSIFANKEAQARTQMENALEEYKRTQSDSAAARVEQARASLITAMNEQSKLAAEQQKEAIKMQQQDMEMFSQLAVGLDETQKQKLYAEFSSLSDNMKDILYTSAEKAGLADSEKAMLDQTTNAIKTIGSIIDQGVPITYSMAQSLSQGSYLKPGDILEFNARAEQIKNDKLLSQEDKIMQMEKLRKEIDNYGKEKLTNEQQNFEYYQELKKTNPELAKQFAKQIGISEKIQQSTYATNATPISLPRSSDNNIQVYRNQDGSISISVPDGYEKYSRVPDVENKKQCAEFVNDVFGTRLFGTDRNQKMGLVNKSITTPSAGMAFVEDVGSYGHVGIVSKVYADGSFDTIEFNRGGSGESSSRHLTNNDVVGFVNNPNANNIMLNPDGTETPRFREDLYPLFSKYNDGKITKADWDSIEDMGVDKEEFTKQAVEAKKSITKDGLDFIEDSINLISKLKTNYWGRDAYKFGWAKLPVNAFGSNDYATAEAALKSKLALDNLINLKNRGATFGALSENELKAIQDSVVQLNSTTNWDDYLSELNKIENRLKDQIINSSLSASQKQSYLDKFDPTKKLEFVQNFLSSGQYQQNDPNDIDQQILNNFGYDQYSDLDNYL